MIGLDAKGKKKGGNSLLVFGLVVKKKKEIYFLSFLADSVFLKEQKNFGCFCFLKKKKGDLVF